MSVAERSDEELLGLARAGDRAAVDALLSRHQERIYRFGLKLCRDPETAKEVLQETLFAMARHMRDFRGASSLSTWLYTIARNFCLKKQRAAPPEHEQLSALANEPSDQRDPEETLAGKEIRDAFDRAIAELEPMYREVLLLRDVEGLTAPEVAEVLGLSVEAVKSRLHRARLRVRGRIAPLLETPEPAPKSDCPDVLSLFSQHLEGDISPSVCAAMERHLESCARCRNSCDSLKRTLGLCRTTTAPLPPEIQASLRDQLRILFRSSKL
jgi:RNA polymerase sigma-70 factor (ECF subfamily)